MVVYTKRFSVSVQIYMCYFLLELNVYQLCLFGFALCYYFSL